jgi:murein DD-endopeptidase MepM/ murein hydrolase activator NlpD
MPKSFALFLFTQLLCFTLSGCGHYQGPGSLKGNGAYKSPSDYLDNEPPQSMPNYVPQSQFKLMWPVMRARVNRGYRPPSDPNHQGIDLGGERGTPILAAHEGRVIYTGSAFRGYGNMVMIEYDQRWASLYGHLDSIRVREGQIVRPGDPLGGMGRSGSATGVHLHFELIHNHAPVDPMSYLVRGSQFARK